LFVFCTVTDFSAAEKAMGVKFCTPVGLLSRQVFSPFGEAWLVTGAAALRQGKAISCSQYLKVEHISSADTCGDGRWAFGFEGSSVA